MIDFNTPLAVVPFDTLENDQYKPAFEKIMAENRLRLEEIANAPDQATFENTIEALEFLNYPLKRLEQVFFNLNAAHTDKKLQLLAQELSPVLTGYYNDITLNKKLYARVRSVYEEREKLAVSSEKFRLLDETYKVFKRNGATLNEDEKEAYKKVTEELSMLCLKFDENLLDETNTYQLHITDKTDLSGLPDYVIEAAALEARSRNLNGWIITLKAPSFIPFMKFADNRKLREILHRAYNSRCFKNDEKDNQQVITKIVSLRLKQAKLLGYASYAHYALEERMVKSPEQVGHFLHEILNASKPAAEEEYAEVTAFARKSGFIFPLEKWDWTYYAEKLKNEKFSVTDEMTKPYFELDRVEKSIFELAGVLYGIAFSPEKSVPVYHPEVKVYKVTDHDGSYLGLLYIDYFPRESKQGGAWMTNYLEQYRQNGKDNRPHVSIVLNFTKPTTTKPSLLTYDEVRTFLHEFGHALHSMLSDCSYMSLSGTNVYRDFVELPSQIMENWAEQKEWLNMAAAHYETGARMPDEMLENILKSRNFNNGFAFIRQLSFGLNDMAWHTITSAFDQSVVEFERAAMAPAELFPPVDHVCFSTGFHHIFGGGYAAGYYGYKWAEVLEADAFSLFEQHGVFDNKTAQSFREHILSKGGTIDPSELFRRFRGHDPSIEPLLIKSGLRKTAI